MKKASHRLGAWVGGGEFALLQPAQICINYFSCGYNRMANKNSLKKEFLLAKDVRRDKGHRGQSTRKLVIGLLQPGSREWAGSRQPLCAVYREAPPPEYSITLYLGTGCLNSGACRGGFTFRHGNHSVLRVRIL